MMRTLLSQLPSVRPALVLSRRASWLHTRAARGRATNNNSLLKIPGIGRSAAQKLAERQVDGVDKLLSVYEERDKDRDALLEYLAETGIHARWRPTIADWVAQQQNDAITLCVEGNVGAGKSTYLNMVKAAAEEQPAWSQLHELVEIVPEPVQMWQDINGENLLELFYKDPERYAFTFQQYVLVTRMQKEETTRPAASASALRLIERSVFCDRMVFVKAVHEAKSLSNLELQIYDSWFNPILSQRPNLIPEGFVYLRTEPETCRRRIDLRSRHEEKKGGLTDAYLKRLGEFHESWLVDGSRRVENGVNGGLMLGGQVGTKSTLFPSAYSEARASRIGVSTKLWQPGASPEMPVIPQLPPSLVGNVVILDSDLLHQSSQVAAAERLHLVPALHVNCDLDIDITDLDACQERAKMMRDFRGWLQAYRRANQALLQAVQDHNASLISYPADLHKFGPAAGPGSLEALGPALARL